jgi:hypothetical protein
MHIQQIGLFERFIVVDDHGLFWSGPLGWMPELREARVFADREQAQKVIKILGQQCREIENGTTFVAEIVVTTASDHWVPLDDLRETLRRYVGIINQVEGDLQILDVEINWDSLREDGDG